MLNSDPSPSLTPEAIARRHRRMQLGLGLHDEDDRRVERIAARPSFDTVEKESCWVFAFVGAFAVGLIVALGTQLSGTPNAPESRVDPVVKVLPTPRATTTRPVFVTPVHTALPTNGMGLTGSTQVTALPTPAPTLSHYEPPPVPVAVPNYAPPMVASTPDYVNRDRRISDLKRQSESLDDLARNVRANSGVSHSTDTQFPDYQAWRHQHNGWTNSESLNQYLKALDQYRNEVRREKWRLEGR